MQFVSYMSPGFPESLFEVFAREIGADLHFERALSGPEPGKDPFRDGEFDLGWVCSTSFVDLAMRSDEPSIRLVGVAWVPDDPDAHGRPVYFGDVMVRGDSDLHSFCDLKGHLVGCNDPVSLSGHHALRHEIENRGADPDNFAKLVFTGGHHNSLDGLLAGEIDACVVDSVVRLGRSRHDAAVADLRIVARLGPWPVQPLVARINVDETTVQRVQRVLLAANDRPDVIAELQKAALTRLVPVGADHYAPVVAAFASPTIP